MSYYRTVFQSEWAMDIVFRDPAQLQRLYPQLIHLGMTSFSSPDVMRFMDKKVSHKGPGKEFDQTLWQGLLGMGRGAAPGSDSERARAVPCFPAQDWQR